MHWLELSAPPHLPMQCLLLGARYELPLVFFSEMDHIQGGFCLPFYSIFILYWAPHLNILKPECTNRLNQSYFVIRLNSFYQLIITPNSCGNFAPEFKYQHNRRTMAMVPTFSRSFSIGMGRARTGLLYCLSLGLSKIYTIHYFGGVSGAVWRFLLWISGGFLVS